MTVPRKAAEPPPWLLLLLSALVLAIAMAFALSNPVPPNGRPTQPQIASTMDSWVRRAYGRECECR